MLSGSENLRLRVNWVNFLSARWLAGERGWRITRGCEIDATPLNSNHFLLVPPKKRNEEYGASESSTSWRNYIQQRKCDSIIILPRSPLIISHSRTHFGRVGGIWKIFLAFHMFFLLFHFKTMSCQAISKSKFSSRVFTPKITRNSMKSIVYTCAWC